MTTTTTKNLHSKLAAIMGSLSGLEPTGTNQHFRYKFWEANQVSGEIRKRFAEHELSFMADVVEWSCIERPKTMLTTIKVLFTITDSQTGEIVSGHGLGQGDDNSDKGVNKAFSAALKYWLLKIFLIGGEDAEADDQTDKRATGSVGSGRVVVEDSDIQGIARGGRSDMATEIQVRKVRTLARDLEMSPEAVNDLVGSILGVDPVGALPAGDEAGPALVDKLGRLSSESIGKVITYMEMMNDPDFERKGSAR